MSSVARGAKAQHLKSFYADQKDRFEVVSIADIVKDQFPEALVGVDAVIHTASPLDGTDPQSTLNVRVLTYVKSAVMLRFFSVHRRLLRVP